MNVGVAVAAKDVIYSITSLVAAMGFTVEHNRGAECLFKMFCEKGRNVMLRLKQ